jgi:translation initiation factor 3 subunit E
LNSMLAEKLNMDQESAERWIVNLIRNAKLDAKIDSKENHVIMGTQYPTVYQNIIQKTKGLSFRSQLLSASLTAKSDLGYLVSLVYSRFLYACSALFVFVML